MTRHVPFPSRFGRAISVGLSALLALVLLPLVAPSASAAACDGRAVRCAIGDTGPGGGIVFYDAGSRQAWGRYLEAAPAGWSGTPEDPQAAWCPPGAAGFTAYVRTGTRIGDGRRNTARIIAACGSETAAARATAYRGGGLADWHLPSKGELGRMAARASLIGGLERETNVLSSSQYRKAGMDTRSVAWARSFAPSGGFGGAGKQSPGTVRPIRAF